MTDQAEDDLAFIAAFTVGDARKMCPEVVEAVDPRERLDQVLHQAHVIAVMKGAIWQRRGFAAEPDLRPMP